MGEEISIQKAIAKVVEGNALQAEEMVQTMRKIMSGECTDAQIGLSLIHI